MSTLDRLDTWLRRQMFDPRNGSTCTHFVLHHLSGSSKTGSEIYSCGLPDNPDSINQLAQEILDSAESDCTGLGSPQSYVLFSHHGEDSKPGGRFVIRARPEIEEEFDGPLSEPANQSGIITQLMRHNESIMRTSTLALGTTMGSLQSMIGKQAEAIDRLLSDRFETVEVIETMMSLKHERELEIMKQQESGERRKLLGEKLGPLVAIAANKLVGKSMLPAANPQSLVLQEFFKTLRPEQLESLQGVLTSEQLMLVLSLAGNYVGGNDNTKLAHNEPKDIQS